MIQYLATLLIEIIATAAITLIIENKFKILHKIKKLYSLILNRSVKLRIILTIKSDNKAKDIGNNISKFWKKEGNNVIVNKDADNDVSISNDEYSLDINLLEDREITIKTSIFEIPIRGVQSKFSEIMNVLEKIEKSSVVSIFISALLPFKFEFIEIKPTSGMNVENYDVSIRNDKWKSQISLKLKAKKQEISVNSKTMAEMYDVLKGLFRIL